MFHRHPNHVLSAPAPIPGAPLYSIRLIDRRTGEVPRLNGHPISFLTSAPRQAVEQLLQGRVRANWTAQVDPVGERGMAPSTVGLGKSRAIGCALTRRDNGQDTP